MCAVKFNTSIKTSIWGLFLSFLIILLGVEIAMVDLLLSQINITKEKTF